jgi:hypothetical protein
MFNNAYHGDQIDRHLDRGNREGVCDRLEDRRNDREEDLRICPVAEVLHVPFQIEVVAEDHHESPVLDPDQKEDHRRIQSEVAVEGRHHHVPFLPWAPPVEKLPVASDQIDPET